MYASTTVKAVCQMWLGLVLCLSLSPTIRSQLFCQVLDEGLDTTGDEDVLQPTSIFVKSMEKLAFNRQIDVWETHVGFPIMQKFSLNILYHLWTYYMKYDLYDHSKINPNQSMDITFALAGRHVWHPFPARRDLRCDGHEGKWSKISTW